MGLSMLGLTEPEVWLRTPSGVLASWCFGSPRPMHIDPSVERPPSGGRDCMLKKTATVGDPPSGVIVPFT